MKTNADKTQAKTSKIAQLKAHAYAEGSDILLNTGQEKHLPHVAWHVVQKKQGRVQATIQKEAEVIKNDDLALEKVADEMGLKAESMLVKNEILGL